jgi:hypothetical protein
MRGIEHLGSPELMLISCSTDEARIRAQTLERIQTQKAAPAPASLGKAGVYNPVLTRALGDPDAIHRMQHVIDTFSEDKCRQMAQLFAQHHTWQIPTLIRLRTSEMGNSPVYEQDPNLRYMPASVQNTWQNLGRQFSEKISAPDQQTLRSIYSLQLRVTRMFADEGVSMLAGSDFGGGWLVAGFSLHQEFDQLAAAGLSPLQILQMTTLYGAQFFSRESSDGSVEEGKNANLVLLDGNPIENVQNLHRIQGVVRAGRYFSKEDLEGLKKRALEHTAQSGAVEPNHQD